MTLHALWAQKTLVQLLDDPTLTQINIQAQEVNAVSISVSQNALLTVKGNLDGEYSTHQFVSLVRKGNTLYVSPDFTAAYKIPNDKLSAHKVFAIALFIKIPAHLEVVLEGLSTQVQATGHFKKLKIGLKDGYCILTNIGTEVGVTTHSGKIVLKQNKGVVLAKSAYGKVLQENIPIGLPKIVLHSVTGFIEVFYNRP